MLKISLILTVWFVFVGGSILEVNLNLDNDVGSGSGSGEVPTEPCRNEFDGWETEYLVLEDKYALRLYWKVHGKNITFALTKQGPTPGGWMGIGFSPYGTMMNADIFMMWMFNGKLKSLDMSAAENTLPTVDDEQNYEVLNSCQDDRQFIVVFTRLIDTCDNDDRMITEGTTNVILAYSNIPITGSEPVKDNYHFNTRGMKRIRLLNKVHRRSLELTSETEVSVNYDSYKNFSFREDGGYYCEFVKLPVFEEPREVVMQDARTDGAVTKVVLYQCAGRLWNAEINEGFECFSSERPHDADLCKTVMAVSVGGSRTAFTYPDGTGLILGGMDAPTYALLEMKYEGKENIGSTKPYFSFIHVDAASANSAGVMQIKALPHSANLIPPNSSAFKIQGRCTKKCLNTVLADVPKINIFAVAFYGQKYTKSIKLRHFRNNTELRPIAFEDNFNTNRNGFLMMNNVIQVQPDDDLIVECDYDTSLTSSVTYFGYESNDEACQAYVEYYPKMNLASCSSAPTEAALTKQYKKSNFQEVGVYIEERSWNEDEIAELDDLLLKSDLYVECSGHSVNHITLNSIDENPKFNYTYKEPSRCGAFAITANVFAIVASLFIILPIY